MTRALALSQRQAQALLRAAEAERGVIEVKIGETVFKLIPAVHAQGERVIDERQPEDFDTLDEYLAWRAKGRAGEDNRRP